MRTTTKIVLAAAFAAAGLAYFQVSAAGGHDGRRSAGTRGAAATLVEDAEVVTKTPTGRASNGGDVTGTSQRSRDRDQL